MRSNREYDYFGNVLEYENNYFVLYSSKSTNTQKVLVLEYEYENMHEYEYDYFALYSSMSMITQKVLLLEYEYKYRVRLLHLLSDTHTCHGNFFFNILKELSYENMFLEIYFCKDFTHNTHIIVTETCCK